MRAILENDWSFRNIRAVDSIRAEALESAGSPDDLVRSLARALSSSFINGKLRVAVDSKENKFIGRRVTLQFRVTPAQYDWFFNGRTGYRAHFWIDPKVGMAFNSKVVDGLRETLRQILHDVNTARRIETAFANGARSEKDVGTCAISRCDVIKSLAPDVSKIWIGERLYGLTDGTIEDIGFASLSAAAQSPAKLCIPRWAKAVNTKTGEAGEGLRAPFPSPEYSWLDLKSGFLDANGKLSQIKPQGKRACDLHEFGWT